MFEAVITGMSFLEAPRAGANGSIWFSDVLDGGLFHLRADGSVERFLDDRRSIGGLAFNADGALLCSGSDGILWFDPATGERARYDLSCDGEPLGSINDIQPDHDGGLYVGTVDVASISAGKQPNPGALYRVDPSGAVTRCGPRDIVISQGIDTSPDRRRLYHADSRAGIYAFDLDGDGRCAGRRLLVAGHGPDGLVVDMAGCIWTANHATNQLLRYDPEGDLLFSLNFPGLPAGAKVTSLCFAGEDLHDLIVVTAGDYWKPAEKGGGLYRARVETPGQPMPDARLPRP
jgi:sugar lactone lactonase YvrE